MCCLLFFITCDTLRFFKIQTFVQFYAYSTLYAFLNTNALTQNYTHTHLYNSLKDFFAFLAKTPNKILQEKRDNIWYFLTFLFKLEICKNNLICGVGGRGSTVNVYLFWHKHYTVLPNMKTRYMFLKSTA